VWLPRHDPAPGVHLLERRRGRTGRFLRAMVGVRHRPSDLRTSLPIYLLDNGWTETMAMGAWIPAWAITGALALVTGHFVHTWHQPLKGQIITLAATPLSVSVFGVIIHMIRAGMALGGRRQIGIRPTYSDRLRSRRCVVDHAHPVGARAPGGARRCLCCLRVLAGCFCLNSYSRPSPSVNKPKA
jgi:hypothetical protein